MAPTINIEEELREQNKAFDYGVFSGGGAKGGIYAGALNTLIDTGILAKMKGVAGSSAGSIMAALAASGITKEAMQKISQEINIKELLGEGFIVNKDGVPLYELIKSTICDNVKTYLDQADIQSICAERLLDIAKEKAELVANKDNLSPEEILELSKQLDATEKTLNQIKNDKNIIENLHDIKQITKAK